MHYSLGTSIVGLRVGNADGVDFIPIKSLFEVLQEKNIRRVVQECGIVHYQQEEAVGTILRGGRRVFAILSMMTKERLISDFIMKHDNFLDTELDSKLPFEESVLRDIIQADYREFYDLQWQVVAPFFKPNLLHRNLHDRCPLPFIEVKPLGEGGFGIISQVTLKASHQGIRQDGGERVVLVRKEMRRSSTMENDFDNEQHILSLLRRLQHPNIVKFYTAYTLKGTPSLLFAAADYDLARFLAQPRPPEFSTEAIFQALYGLSSAIGAVHSYFFEADKLRLIGCHYDLKPKNILVQGTQLILADFGLSRMKSEEQGSRSDFKFGLGDYLAPECQTLQGGFEKHRIGRGSDIWSFGCILAEMATFMESGSQGVENFAQRRKIKVGGFLTIYTFHAGDNNANDGVITHLDALERCTTSSVVQKGLLYLIRDMLELQVSKRPTAAEVSARLFFLAQKTIFDIAAGMFALLAKNADFELSVEYERFKIWAKTVGFDNVSRDGQKSTWFQDSSARIHFEKIRDALLVIREALTLQCGIACNEAPEATGSVNYYGLQTSIDNLWDTQSQKTLKRMNSDLEDILLDESDKQPFTQVIVGQNRYRKIQLLFAMKQAMASVSKYGNGEVQFSIDKNSLKKVGELNQRWLVYKENGYGTESYALMEMLEYDDKWNGRFDDLVMRVDDLVSLLGKPELSGSFPLLRCTNFCHFPEAHAFGLIYELPFLGPEKSLQPRPITLKDLIRQTQERLKRPPIGDIFRLAHTLASSLLGFHKATWLHKSISSLNIIFFPDAFECVAKSIASPYLIGFNHSRVSNDFVFTEGPCFSFDRRDYQHPDYVDTKRKVRFREGFDYYSLGVVLLELGLWKVLKSFTKNMETKTPHEIKDHLVKEEVPQLRSYMGEVYQDAVMACLTGKYPHGRGVSPREAYSVFQNNVADPLSKCFA